MYDFYFSLPSRWFEILDELNKLMKEMMAEQKARIALGNHIAQLKYAKKFSQVKTPQYGAIHIYYPIRATKCNKCGIEQRCIRTREKKYGKKLA